jgi:hypothetical protein
MLTRVFSITFVGMITGYILHRVQVPPKIPMAINISLWSISLFTLFIIIFGVERGELSLVVTSFYVSLGHTGNSVHSFNPCALLKWKILTLLNTLSRTHALFPVFNFSLIESASRNSSHFLMCAVEKVKLLFFFSTQFFPGFLLKALKVTWIFYNQSRVPIYLPRKIYYHPQFVCTLENSEARMRLYEFYGTSGWMRLRYVKV